MTRTRASALYTGSIVHTRRDEHARRRFRYPVYMASLDLEELPALDAELRLFSHDRCNVFSFRDRDYAGEGDVRAALGAELDRHGLPRPTATRLITNLRVAGYVFNPVSFFLCYGPDLALSHVIAEVNNTYGGRLRYVLGPAQRLPSFGRRVGFRHDRELFVSPFLHGPRVYEFWFDAPLDGDRLAITMHVDTPDGDRVLIAHLDGSRRVLTDATLARAALRYPLMTLQVIGLIHFEALRLRLRGLRYRRPAADHRPLDDPRPATRPIDRLDARRRRGR